MKKPDWLSCPAIYHVKCHGQFLPFFDVTMDISDGKCISGKSGTYILTYTILFLELESSIKETTFPK